MGYALTVTAPDQYTPASTIEVTGLTSIVLDVSNSSIYWQVKIPVGASGNWESQETQMIPGSRKLSIDDPGVAGIRVRAVIPAAQIVAPNKQAVVTIRAD